MNCENNKKHYSIRFNHDLHACYLYVSKAISFFSFFLIITLTGCTHTGQGSGNDNWDISILPSSVRLDPVNNTIIDEKYYTKDKKAVEQDILTKNWVYDGQKANLYAARGEYVSFQLVLTNNNIESLHNILINIKPFQKDNQALKIKPELFLEWSVDVKTISTGYTKTSLGSGWYPDALIPFENIQYDTTNLNGRWVYPLVLPDFNNRIEGQKSLIVWVDQYVPFNAEEAEPGVYNTTINVQINGKSKSIPIELNVWDFAIPNQNLLGASLQQEGFASSADSELELEIYQLLKRNRVSVMDPTYKPELVVSKSGKVDIDWKNFDSRLTKYFNGEAFTEKFGYNYGPGYGEPIENFILPFDVYGKYGTDGWPNTGKPNVERNSKNRNIYINSIKTFRDHFLKMVDSEKTELTVYLNGLDESYNPEAWSRMIFYGNLFKKYFPEVNFRIDGAYPDSVMNLVIDSIGAWGSHTINYNVSDVKKYKEKGIKDWVYGPLIYEGKVNSWVGSCTFIDLPLVNERGLSWTCFKYGTHSWLSWGIGAGWKAAWYDPETWKDQYINGADSDSCFIYKKLNGSGMLIYAPGIIPHVNDVCPSIRLKNMRNGIQEYEYFRMIKNEGKKGEQILLKLNDIINEPFGTNSIGNIDVWSFDARLWDQFRIEAGMHLSSNQ